MRHSPVKDRRLSAKCFYHLRQLKIIRRSLSEAAAKTMPSSPVGLITATASCTVSVQLIFAHCKMFSILRKQGRDITSDIRDLLHWLPVQQRIEYKICVLVYKCLHQSASTYLSELCIPVAASANGVTFSCARQPRHLVLQD